MSYAALSEVWGTDFAQRMNQVDSFSPLEHFDNQMNPSRNDANSLPGVRDGDNLSRTRRAQTARHRAERRSHSDRRAHRESFTDVSGVRNKMLRSEFRPWGDEEDIHEQEYQDAMSPKEYLERSLVGNGNLRKTLSGYPPNSVGEARVKQVRKFKAGTPNDHLVSRKTGDVMYAPFNPLDYGSEHGRQLEPVGYGGPVMTYGDVSRNEQSPCQDYFYHLDTCRRCQKKLKKRVVRYLRALQRHDRNPMLPGTQGMTPSMDRELFSDYDDTDEMMIIQERKARSAPRGGEIQNKRGELCLAPPSKPIPDRDPSNEDVQAMEEVQEGFANLGHDFTPGMFLILFGLFVIYSLDTSRKVIKGGGVKIVR